MHNGKYRRTEESTLGQITCQADKEVYAGMHGYMLTGKGMYTYLSTDIAPP